MPRKVPPAGLAREVVPVGIRELGHGPGGWEESWNGAWKCGGCW